MAITCWSKVRSWSRLAPLLAAIIAPLSTLLDIPALAESWFRDDFEIPIKDPRGSVVLSAAGLAFNVVANLLLLVRFSTTTSETVWGWATRLSVFCWWAKVPIHKIFHQKEYLYAMQVALALANISVFGLPRPGTSRGEGFWCACVLPAVFRLYTYPRFSSSSQRRISPDMLRDMYTAFVSLGRSVRPRRNGRDNA
jgi:potassium channel subfamily K